MTAILENIRMIEISDVLAAAALGVSFFALYYSRKDRTNADEVEATKLFGQLNIDLIELDHTLVLSENYVNSILPKQTLEKSRVALRRQLEGIKSAKESVKTLKSLLQPLRALDTKYAANKKMLLRAKNEVDIMHQISRTTWEQIKSTQERQEETISALKAEVGEHRIDAAITQMAKRLDEKFWQEIQ